MTQKTTVYLDVDDYARLKAIARVRRQAPAQLVREAVSEYTARHAKKRRPKSLGIAASGRRDLGERAEEFLAGMGRSK
jgi:predicted transcriptional regulator